MDAHFAARTEAGIGPSTLNVDLASLRAFVKWLRARGLAPALDPLGSKRWAKITPELKMIVPPEEWPRLLNAADHPISRMVVSTGLYLFTRASESQAIRLRDVNLDDGSIVVHVQKTNEIDRMPISEEYGAELRRYLAWYQETVKNAQPDYYLHPRKIATGNRWGNGDSQVQPDLPIGRISDVVNGALAGAGWPVEGNRSGGHTLRRSGAVALYRELSEVRGHDGAIRIVSTMLHHADISTTEGYLDLRLDRVVRDKLLKGQPMFSRGTPPHLRIVG
jgi:integrase